MKLDHYVKSLTLGVLHNTAAGQNTFRTTDQYNSLLAVIQEGLTRLYSRFLIRERHVLIEMRVGITFYHLKKLYTMQNGDRVRVPYPYIMDLPNDPFEEDVIKILQVMDSAGNVRPLNDPNRHDSLYTVQYDVLQNSYPRDLEALMVTYQANHPQLIKYLPPFHQPDTPEPEPGEFEYEYAEEIMLPQALYPALDNYVAYMVYSRVGTAEAMAKAAVHMQVFDAVCLDAESMDLTNGSMSCTNTRFQNNSWK